MHAIYLPYSNICTNKNIRVKIFITLRKTINNEIFANYSICICVCMCLGVPAFAAAYQLNYKI